MTCLSPFDGSNDFIEKKKRKWFSGVYILRKESELYIVLSVFKMYVCISYFAGHLFDSG